MNFKQPCSVTPLPWGEHLDLARCAARIGEFDLGRGTIVLAVNLHLLQRDLAAAGYSESQPLQVRCDGAPQTRDHLLAVLTETP